MADNIKKLSKLQNYINN